MTFNDQAFAAAKKLNQKMRTKRASAAHSSCEYVYLRYHITDVAVYDFERELLWLNDGGHKTNSTKSRINDFCEVLDLPVRVYQHKFEWFVSIGNEVQDFEPGKPISVRSRSRIFTQLVSGCAA